MNWETLINGGFLVIGLLIGHFLTKSSQIKQLRAQFEYQSKSKWIDDITDYWTELDTAIDEYMLYKRDFDSFTIEVKDFALSDNEKITHYRETRNGLLDKIHLIALHHNSLLIRLSTPDTSHSKVIDALHELGEFIEKGMDNLKLLGQPQKKVEDAIRNLLQSERKKLGKLI